MTERVRSRHKRRLPHTSEDVMAFEPDVDFSTAGGHFPRVFLRQDDDGESSDGYGDEDLQHLLPDPNVDPNANWFKRTHATLKGDISSILLLLFLYLLQGVPLGLIGAIPLLLSSKHASYSSQAIFSFAYWPFSMKLLWAPIVDSVYSKRLGRRKSWMVPCQYLIGAFMLYLSFKVNDIMGENGGSPNVVFLMLIFLPLNFLAATQDIAVDGWALTMLSKKNVGYASTCNAVGQTAGYFLGNVVFLALESAPFCNEFLRSKDNQQDTGMVDLAGYVFFWGWVFIVTTTLVLILKREVDMSIPSNNTTASGEPAPEDEELELGVVESYTVLYKIMKLKPVHYMIAILLTGKLAFAATDGMTSLKLIAMGIPKDRLASIAVFLTPMQILLPWMIGKWTAGPRPLNIFLLAFPYRIFIGGVFAALIWWTPHFQLPDGKFEYSVYFVWISGYMFHQLATYSMFVSMMAFIAQISDPRIGGTYMTMLNTLNNLGGNWPVTVVLAVTDWFTYKDCVVKGSKDVLYACNTKVLADQCAAGGDVCEVAIDGYFISVAACSVIGVIWYKVFFNKLKYLQKIPRAQWRVFPSRAVAN
ncbi:hypothetical protein L5515_013056 [Caenorhabditis briggsae]|uniref:Acetyl-coenzyme A transporter 1 n=1 Tax=Caenorhabditis briggsae TaxID=6238 RepID=A0AAE9DGU4_CAEBR|nr:hypothetical protein L3Y34_016903 [Caenorhabditis briggsae]UMM15742.1 hypothetical protein L5515_013056 [Caenorhabditis briggsae]